MKHKNEEPDLAAQFQPYKDTFVTRLEKSEMEVAMEFFLCGHNTERLKNLIMGRYKDALAYNKRRITATLMPLYKREIHFSDRITGEVINKIYMILRETDRNIPDLVKEFNDFFGEEVSFFKGNTPVGPESICAAFKAMQLNSTKDEVKHILYR